MSGYINAFSRMENNHCLPVNARNISFQLVLNLDIGADTGRNDRGVPYSFESISVQCVHYPYPVPGYAGKVTSLLRHIERRTLLKWDYTIQMDVNRSRDISQINDTILLIGI